MQHEGMVHALEEVHRLLKPAGILIEMHPAVDAPPYVEVRSNGQLFFSEGDPVFDYEEDLRQADAAVTTVLDRGLFVLEDRRRFKLLTYAASVKEMRDHWAFVGAYDPRSLRRRSFAGATRCMRAAARWTRLRGYPTSCTWSRPRCLCRPSQWPRAGSIGCHPWAS